MCYDKWLVVDEEMIILCCVEGNLHCGQPGQDWVGGFKFKTIHDATQLSSVVLVVAGGRESYQPETRLSPLSTVANSLPPFYTDI